MSSDSGSAKMADATYAETGSAGSEKQQMRKASFGQKVKAHFRRFWIAHLIIFLLGTLLITLILVYAAFPKIAQDGVNKSTLTVNKMVLSDPKPKSFHLHQEQVLKSTSAFHPKLDAFNASLFLESSEPNIKSFGQVLVPSIVAGAETPMNLDQVVDITDVEAYTDFTKVVLTSETYRLAIRGAPILHQEKFPAKPVNYNEVIELKGLNGLKGFNLTSFEIKINPEKDGSNMIGRVFIPNPSVMTIAMGNVTLDNFVKGTKIGESRINELTLVPGDNNFDMRSTVNQSMVINMLNDYPDGKLPVDVIGREAVYNGEHLPYYEAALASNKQSLFLDVKTALNAILGGGSK